MTALIGTSFSRSVIQPMTSPPWVVDTAMVLKLHGCPLYQITCANGMQKTSRH
jgi:hypothetical protein